jgi:hypothetical protein
MVDWIMTLKKDLTSWVPRRYIYIHIYIQSHLYSLSLAFFSFLLALIQCTMDQIFFFVFYPNVHHIKEEKPWRNIIVSVAVSGNQHVLWINVSMLIIIIIQDKRVVRSIYQQLLLLSSKDILYSTLGDEQVWHYL